MTRPLVLVDVGETLVHGPARGPASRIAATLGLAAGDKRALHAALMTSPFEQPGDVAAFLRERGVPAGAPLDAAVADVWTAQQTEAQPIDGAEQALLDLRAHDVRLAVVSNIWKPYLDGVRARLGALLDEHVEPSLQLFSFRERCAKPAPELLRRALERARVDPADAVMVGDSYANDIAPAAALGVPTVWLLQRAQHEVESIARVLNARAVPPSCTLASIRELSADVVARALGRTLQAPDVA